MTLIDTVCTWGHLTNLQVCWSLKQRIIWIAPQSPIKDFEKLLILVEEYQVIDNKSCNIDNTEWGPGKNMIVLDLSKLPPQILEPLLMEPHESR